MQILRVAKSAKPQHEVLYDNRVISLCRPCAVVYLASAMLNKPVDQRWAQTPGKETTQLGGQNDPMSPRLGFNPPSIPIHDKSKARDCRSRILLGMPCR